MFKQKKLVQTIILAGLAVAGTQAHADNSVPGAAATTVTAPAKKDAPAPGESVDDLITNNNLRALSGSTSLWSIASQFNYNGGTLGDPLSQDRPNISAGSATTTKADLDGQISAKYSLGVKDALMAGVGIRWIAPFSTGNLKNYAGTAFDVMNPYLQYQHVYKWFGIQSVVQIQGLLWTQADQTVVGYQSQWTADQENMYEIGKTGLSVGASTYVQFENFNKHNSSLLSSQSIWSFGIAPELEYQVSEKINLRTLVSLLTFENYASYANRLVLTQDAIYESVGVGISLTRNVFLYPNVQFLPGNLALDQTNVGLTATINMF